jgi:hypothetical protein
LVDHNTSLNILRSARTGLKLTWKHYKIENFASRLDKFRSILTLGTVLALRTSTSDYSEKILSHLERLRSAGLAEPGENGEILQGVQKLLDLAESQSMPKLVAIQEHVRLCLDQISELREHTPQTLEKAILRWLNFRQMCWRYEEVPLAYQKTFQWIFERGREEKTWDDFSAHLTKANVHTAYWINGKAGSGKSTLMKFVLNDSRTEESLARWAGGDELLILNFFFWNLGTPLQKSSVGMLRAFLHSVLDKHPELIPAVFPGLYQNWKNTDANSEPTYTEVKKAFEILVEKASRFLKLCIFVDGIDEFEGDHKDISLFLCSLVSPQVKVVVSSRPINACIHAFQGCSTLRLQDLTNHDMQIFVKGNLSSHQFMVELTKRFPQDANDLVTEIQTKAEGVFLWVKLVVRLLVDGLESGDDMKDLKRKLRLLPADLRELYRRMMSQMKPEYQAQAAKIFQLLHTWNSIVPDQPLKTLALSFAFEPSQEALNREVAPLEMETLEWMLQSTEAKIRSRCCGLLEIHKKPRGVHDPASYTERINESVVSYLHRTVAEFLQFDEVWEEVCSMTDKSAFNSHSSLTYASVSMMKIERSYHEPNLREDLTNTLDFCRHATNFCVEDLDVLMNTIDRTMNHYWQVAHDQGSKDIAIVQEHWYAGFWSVVKTVQPSYHKDLHKVGNIHSLAARAGLIQYLRAFSNFPSMSYLARSALVVHALESWLNSPQNISLQDRSETLLFLLQNSARPEDVGFGETLWQNAIVVGVQLATSYPADSAELLRVFIITANSYSLSMRLHLQSIINKKNAMDIIHVLQNHGGVLSGYDHTYVDGSDIKHLGAELHRLAFSKTGCKLVSQRFIDIVSSVSLVNPALSSRRTNGEKKAIRTNGGQL